MLNFLSITFNVLPKYLIFFCIDCRGKGFNFYLFAPLKLKPICIDALFSFFCPLDDFLNQKFNFESFDSSKKKKEQEEDSNP